MEKSEWKCIIMQHFDCFYAQRAMSLVDLNGRH